LRGLVTLAVLTCVLLPPFALWPDLPISLVRRYPHDSYDGSVTICFATGRWSRGTSLRYVLAPLRASTHPLNDLVGHLSRSRIVPAPRSCQYRAWHRLQAFFRWVRTSTKSEFEFRQSSFTHRERVVRMPYPTTLSGMHRLPDMLLSLSVFHLQVCR